MLRKKCYIFFYTFCYSRIHNIKYLPLTRKLLIINQGSLTQNINSIKGTKICIDLVYQQVQYNHQITRRVWIQNKRSELIFAESCWNKTHKKVTESTHHQAIGQSIIINEVDTYKKIENFNCGYHYYLQKKFSKKSLIWSRQHSIWHNRWLLITVQEFFNFSKII